jgi:hypothetical protein
MYLDLWRQLMEQVEDRRVECDLYEPFDSGMETAYSGILELMEKMEEKLITRELTNDDFIDALHELREP